MLGHGFFSFGKTILFISLVFCTAACGGKDAVQNVRGNIGPHALDLTRLSKEERDAAPSPKSVWIPFRPGSSFLVKGWNEAFSNEEETDYVVTSNKRAGIRIPFAPADQGHMDFTLCMKWISHDPTDGDEQRTFPIKVLFNHKRVGILHMKNSWDDFNFKIPADWFQMGSNYFIFLLSNEFFEGVEQKRTRSLAFKGFSVKTPTSAMYLQVDRIVRRTVSSGGAVSIKLPEPLPEGAELYFSLAVIPDLMPSECDAIRFRLVASPEWSQSQGKTTHFEYTWETAHAEGENGFDQKERWHDAHVSLAEFAGKKVMLTLHAETVPSGRNCFHAWGPMILTWDKPEKQRPLQKESEFNLVLILVDTLRADRVGTYGSELGLTPGLDDLASKGIVFEDVVAQGSSTIISISSFLTGCYYNTIHEWVKKGSLPSSNPRFAEVLQSAGFRTTALISNPLLVPESDFSRGYDEYDQKVERLPAAELNRIFFSRLPLLEKTRFFAYLHYMDVHAPYGDPENKIHAVFETGRLKGTPLTGSLRPLADEILEHRGTSIGEADRVTLDRLYNDGIRYLDKHLARLLAILEKRGLLQKTIIVVMADHGEEILDHGLISHGHTLYDELVHVPLIMFFPKKGGVYQPQRIKIPVQLLDVGPTILDFLGIPIPPSHRGRNLTPILHRAKKYESEKESWESRDRFFETRYRYWRQPPFNDHLAGICKGEWKFILNHTNGQEKLFHLASDPQETKNLIKERPHIAAELRDLLHAWEKKEKSSKFEKKSLHSTKEVSDQIMHRLRDLGYLD